MSEKVLVPLDGSLVAEGVLDHIAALARSSKTPNVVLLRVIHPLLAPSRGDLTLAAEYRIKEEKLEASARDYLISITNILKEKGIAAETKILVDVTFGDPAHEVLDYADKEKVDLIILSTHGMTGIARWAFGSVTDRVLRHSKVPVLAVPPYEFRRGK